MISFFLHIPQADFHVIQWGKGPKLLVCFHGFGESAAEFSCLEPSLGDIYTLVAIDLPFHGSTRWNGEVFDQEIVRHLAEKILEHYQLSIFSVLGYSLGGRVALSLVEALPQQVQQLILVAPDGVRDTFWVYPCDQDHFSCSLFVHSFLPI